MTDQIFQVVRDLVIAGIVAGAYITAKRADTGCWETVWRGFLYCGGIALFAALVMGQPSCEDAGDRLFGGCEAFADDGYEATPKQRAARFLYYFVLLYIPVLIAAGSEQKKFQRGGRAGNREMPL